MAIGFRLGTLGTMQQVTSEWLDKNPTGVLFLDERKQIVFANRTARTFEHENDGIRLGPRGLSLLDRRDNEKLKGLLDQVISHAASPNDSPGGTMRAKRPSGKQPYGIMVGPVSARAPLLSGPRPVVCVVITDPDRRTPMPDQRLQTAFGLTKAEARLAALLANGEGLRSAADQLGITYGTARTCLAGIFQKTETRRQGELIRLLLTTLGTL